MRRADPMRWRPIVAVLWLLGIANPYAHAQSCATPTVTVRGAAVVDDLDIALEDGRTLKLAGLDPARATPGRPGLGETARHRLETAVVGRDLAIAVLAASPDRWERYPALVIEPGPPAAADIVHGAPASINEVLIAEGWARVRPESALRACLPAWLTLEAGARGARLGLWADPYYAIINADDRQGLAERAGAMALVEGRVRLVQVRGRMSLRLGDAFGVVALMTRSGATSLARAGLDPHRLVGSRVRLRGFLDDRFGPRIDVIDAGQVEVMDTVGFTQADEGGARSAPAVSGDTEAPGRP